MFVFCKIDILLLASLLNRILSIGSVSIGSVFGGSVGKWSVIGGWLGFNHKGFLKNNCRLFSFKSLSKLKISINKHFCFLKFLFSQRHSLFSKHENWCNSFKFRFKQTKEWITIDFRTHFVIMTQRT